MASPKPKKRNCKVAVPGCVEFVEDLKSAEQKVGGIWTPVKMKKIDPKKVVTDVYHQGRVVGGVPETAAPCLLLPLKYQTV
jgi:hypothetical protein